MSFPRIALLVPLLAAGIFVPAFGPAPRPAAAGILGMEHEKFATEQVSVPCGGRLTMQNDSRWAHIIGPGQDGLLVVDRKVPVARRELMETDAVFTTGAWDTPGTYYLTCAVHPEMTVKVVVTKSCCCPSAGG